MGYHEGYIVFFRFRQLFPKKSDLFFLFAMTLCWGLTLANSRTCKCSVKLHPYANANALLHSSFKLRSRNWLEHISCDDVKTWCHKTGGPCHNWGNDQLVVTASLDAMCLSYGTTTYGVEVYAHSQVMNNCGATRDSHILNKKLCCMTLPPPTNRTVGWSC